MPIKALPRLPSLEQYKKQARDLLKRHQAGDTDTLIRLRQFHPRFAEPRSAKPGFAEAAEPTPPQPPLHTHRRAIGSRPRTWIPQLA